MAPGGEMFRYSQHLGENVLRHGSHEWLPYSVDEVRLKSSNNNLSFCQGEKRMGGSAVEREGNYAIQANQAKAHFLSYDQEKLRRKLNLRVDESWLYTALFGVPYRIHRKTASV